MSEVAVLDQEVVEDNVLDTKENHIGEEADAPEFVKQDLDQIADLADKAGVFKKSLNALKTAGMHLKEYPEIIGVLTAGTLGALGVFADWPIPGELASKMSAIVGVGTLGYSKGDTRLQKIGYALSGALVGLAIGEEAHHVSDSGIIEAGVGIADDIPLLMLGGSALMKRWAGKNSSGRMEEPVTRETNPLSSVAPVEAV